VRLAIIGSYGHVGVVLSALQADGSAALGVEVVGVAPWGAADALGSVDRALPGRGRRFADWRSMLEKEKPDVAAVFTPFAQLATVATAAAERGCHVFMEKPVATTAADLEALREAVARSGVELAACFAMRGEPAFRTIRQAIADGRIGRVVYAAAQKSYPFNERDEFYRTRASYGGTIPWIGIHALDFIAWCTGQDYRRVAAVAGNFAHPSRPGMEDAGGILAELINGAAAVVNFDYLRPWGQAKRPWGDDRLRVAGTEGILETTDCGQAVELMTPDAVESLELLGPVNVFEAFLAGLEGRREPLITTAESFRMTEVALRARDAQDGGKFLNV